MNKALIGALVGGLILFLWQFLSWSVLGIHSSEMAYTDKQDVILQCLNESGVEEGTYFLPNAPADMSSEERQAMYEANIGKPWAMVSYHDSMSANMASNMIRGLVVNILAVFLLCYILIGRSDLTMQKTIISAVMVGLISYFTTSYMGSIWFETDTIGHLIDAIVQWAACGAWLGFWLNR